MTRKLTSLLGLLLLCLGSAWAQTEAPPFPVTLQKELAAKASNYTEVSLDKRMLSFASSFMGKGQDNQQAKHLIENLNGIYVRTYEFEKEGEYTQADLAAIRRQFAGQEWSPMVRERSKGDGGNTDIYMKMVGGQIQGMVVLDAEPKELNFVYISGPIRPEELGELGGNFGVPNLNTGAGHQEGKPSGAGQTKATPSPKGDEQ